jgi:hypothetical protein
MKQQQGQKMVETHSSLFHTRQTLDAKRNFLKIAVVWFWPLPLIQSCGHRFKITGISTWWVWSILVQYWATESKLTTDCHSVTQKSYSSLCRCLCSLENIRGYTVRDLGTPFRRFAFEYAHYWQGCRYVCQLPVTRLTPRVSWQIYLAWTSEVKLAEHSNTQLRVSHHLPTFRTRLSWVYSDN